MDIIGYISKVKNACISSYREMWLSDDFTCRGHDVHVPELFKFKSIGVLYGVIVERTFLSLQNPFCKKKVPIFPIEAVYHYPHDSDTVRILYIGHIGRLLDMLDDNSGELYKSLNELIFDFIGQYDQEDNSPTVIDLEKYYRSDTLDNVSYHIDNLYTAVTHSFKSNYKPEGFNIRSMGDRQVIPEILEECMVELPINDRVGSTLSVMDRVTNKTRCLGHIFCGRSESKFRSFMRPHALLNAGDNDVIQDISSNEDVDLYAIAQYIHVHYYTDIYVVISNNYVDVKSLYSYIFDTEFMGEYGKKHYKADRFRRGLWETIAHNTSSAISRDTKITIHKNSYDEQSYVFKFLNKYGNVVEQKYFIDGHLLQLTSRSIMHI